MWRAAFDPEEKRLTLQLRDQVSGADLEELATAQAEALRSTGGSGFSVFMDLRGLFPLDAEAVPMLGEIKTVAAEYVGCRVIVVLTDSPTIALQQSRTKLPQRRGGPAEWITLDPAEAFARLGKPLR